MRQSVELVAALVCVLLLTAAYLLVATVAPLRPGSLLGHGIGILGFALMLITEVLYSWRKTRRSARWGQTRTWLSAHVFTGIVGPYMVLLHTGFRFAGLAGIVFWMTIIVVCSGFVGRYIYTAIPRTSTGTEMEADQIAFAISQIDIQLRTWLAGRPAQFEALVEEMKLLPVTLGSGIVALFSTRSADRRYRQSWQRALEGVGASGSAEASELESLLDRRRVLQRHAVTLTTTRRLMAAWHALHVPLAVALFTAAVLHIVAALYFA